MQKTLKVEGSRPVLATQVAEKEAGGSRPALATKSGCETPFPHKKAGHVDCLLSSQLQWEA
jgi:hypothetical protein